MNFGLDPTAQRTLEEALTTGFRTDVSGLGDILRQQAEQQFQRSSDIERERLAGLGAASSSARVRGVADIRSQLESQLQRQLLEAEIGASEAAAGRRFGAIGSALDLSGQRLGALGELGGLDARGIDQRIAALQGAGNLGLGADQLQLGSRQDLLDLLTRQAPGFGGGGGTFGGGPSTFGGSGFAGAFGAGSAPPNLSGRQTAITPGASRVTELDRLGQIGGTSLQFNPGQSVRGGQGSARGIGRFFSLGAAAGGRIPGEDDGAMDDSAGTFRLDEGELVVPAALTRRLMAADGDDAGALLGALKRVASRLVPADGGQAGGLAAQSRVQEIGNILRGAGGPVTRQSARGRLTARLGPGEIPEFELVGAPGGGLPGALGAGMGAGGGSDVQIAQPDPLEDLMRQRSDAARRANLLRSAILERPNRPSNDRLIDSLLSEQEAIQLADQGIGQLLGFQADIAGQAAMQQAAEAQAAGRVQQEREKAQAAAAKEERQGQQKAATEAQQNFQAELNRAVTRQLQANPDQPVDIEAAQQEAAAIIQAAGGTLPEGTAESIQQRQAEQQAQQRAAAGARQFTDPARAQAFAAGQPDPTQAALQQQQQQAAQAAEAQLQDLEARAGELAPNEIAQAAAILRGIVDDLRTQNPDTTDEEIERILSEAFPGLTGALDQANGTPR